MSYASLADLSARFGDRMLIALTDRGDMATLAIDVTVVDKAIAETDAIIDGYLARRYAVPVTPVPPLLCDLALAIIIWKLHLAAPDPKVEADYRDALRSLRDISSGLLALAAPGAVAEVQGASGARFTDRDRPFSADDMKGFI